MTKFSSQFGQLMTAMVTPFKEDLSLDFEALEKLINHLIATGTKSILLTGTTGENPTLTHEEEWELLKVSQEIIKKRVPVVFGAGSNSTKTAIESSIAAQKAGVDAVMSVCPYYNKPNQEGMFKHFAAVAEAVKIPVMLYNNPGRTGVSLEAQTIAELNRKHSNISSIKESSGSLDLLALIQNQAPDFEIYCGDDNLTLPALAVGAKGVVSVASHVCGEQISELIKNVFNGNLGQAARIHLELFSLFKALFSSPSPGIIKPYLRLPLTPPAEEVRKTLSKVLAQVSASRV
jgi:4-hydroxy-tetrahydrodipicolinate synthase